MPSSPPILDTQQQAGESTDQSRACVEEFVSLLESGLPPTEFYAAFLRQLLATLKCQSGAVWGMSSEGGCRLEYQINLSSVGLEKIDNAQIRHGETLKLVAQRKRPLYLPPQSGADRSPGKVAPANPTPYSLFLAPILIEQQVVGVVEVWQEGKIDQQKAREVSRFVSDAAGFVAAYLHKHQWDQVQEQQHVTSEVEAFARQVHHSLNSHEVAHLIVNEGRRLTGCDQMSVAIRQGSSTEVVAISGAPFLEKRGTLVRSMRDLFGTVLNWGEKLVYQGIRDGSLPPKVLNAQDAFLAQSNSRLLVVLPLRDGREKENEGCRSALLVECFNPDFHPEPLQQRLELLAPHAGSALYNAIEHGRIPLRGLSTFFSWLGDLTRGRRAIKTGLILGVLLALVCCLIFIQVPLRMEAKGELLPQDRQIVYSTLSGKIVEVKAHHGELVGKGQELLLMEDLETQLKIEQLGLRVSSAQQRIAILNQRLAKTTSNEERNTLVKERVDQEYEMRRAAAERDILLQGARNPRKTPVRSPLSGKVVTFDTREKLVGKTVKPGDPLLRVADIQGRWEVELCIPEGHIGAIRQGLEKSKEKTLGVDILLSSHPQRTFKGKLTAEGLGGETLIKNNEVVLPARVQITDRDLLTQLEGMPVGVEVKVKVHCGHRALGYVLFFDLWEFVYEHVLF